MPQEQSRRQLHVWLDSSDYEFIKRLAKHRDESVSRLFRRLIANWRKQIGTTEVQEVAERPEPREDAVRAREVVRK